MIQSIYHPSGNLSIAALRELIKIMPNAVVMSDADTLEILAYSYFAEELFGLDNERYYQVEQHHADVKAMHADLERLKQNDGKPIRVSGEVFDTQRCRIGVVGSVAMYKIAGRNVLISAMEPGYPMENLPHESDVPTYAYPPGI